MTWQRWHLSLGLLIALSVAVVADEPADTLTGPLEQAYLEGKITLQQFVAKKDSLFSLINEQYRPVKPILQKSCFDCHSQATQYPWYYELPIIKGILDDHITEGRESLDMSDDFPFSGKGDSFELLGEIKEEIEDEKMPPLSYRLLHWGTLIEGSRRDSVLAWIDSTSAILAHFYSPAAADTNSQAEDPE